MKKILFPSFRVALVVGICTQSSSALASDAWTCAPLLQSDGAPTQIKASISQGVGQVTLAYANGGEQTHQAGLENGTQPSSLLNVTFHLESLPASTLTLSEVYSHGRGCGRGACDYEATARTRIKGTWTTNGTDFPYNCTEN